MKKQVFNPYLPGWEYIPDGEPRLFGGRLYIFGSHDKAGGKAFCLNDYVAWSAPEDDLSDWRYEGVIYKREQHPHQGESVILYAPDVTKGPDGRYYLYYSAENSGRVSVAVCNLPAGLYEYLGDVHRSDGHVLGTAREDWFQFDPSVLVDTDGRIWLYSGSGQKHNEKFGHPVVGCFVMELEQDMVTVKDGPKLLLQADESRKKPSFFEGASVRHIGSLYYLVYPATDLTGLNYATSKYPDRDYVYRGRIHSTSDIGLEGRGILQARYQVGNNHGGLVCVKGQWYIFDHRMTNKTMFSRQGVAEPVTINADGSIDMVEATSCGLNGGPLMGTGKYPAYIACNLIGRRVLGYQNPLSGPYVTQDEPDYNPDDGKNNIPLPYITHLKNGYTVGYKYFDFQGVDLISIVFRGKAKGIISLQTQEKGGTIARIPVKINTDKWKKVESLFPVSDGKHALYFQYYGRGHLDIKAFEFKRRQ